MAKTQIADIIVPELFEGYVVERTAAKSRLFQSGLIEVEPSIVKKITEGGDLITMPFWQDLQGDDETLSDNGTLTTGKIGASKDLAVVYLRGKAFSVNDLSRKLSGDDPMKTIGDLFADYWLRRHQATLLSSLIGVFGAATMAANTLDIFHTTGGVGSAGVDNILDGDVIQDGKQKLGDNKGTLTAIAMHSAVETSLTKLELIETIPPSEGKPEIKMFQGMEVIIDDDITVEAIDGDPVYSTYLFGRGAFGYAPGDGSEPAEGGVGTWGVEFSRTALAGDSSLINRKRFVLHPRGVKFTSASVAGEAPTNAEAATATNWERVYEQKNVRIVRIRHNV